MWVYLIGILKEELDYCMFETHQKQNFLYLLYNLDIEHFNEIGLT